MPSLSVIKYLVIILMSVSISACVSDKYALFSDDEQPPVVVVPEDIKKHYGAVKEGNFVLPAIDMSTIDSRYWRKLVDFPTSSPIGTIFVDTGRRFLYLVQPNGKAIRYGVGVGKEGLALTGTAVVGAKVKWPHWSPTKDMMVRDPDIYGNMQKGLPPGVDNPLGARALYLFKNGKDSHFRIHGSHESWSIGKAMSSGCIRMLNQDVIDLFKHVSVGAKVIIIDNKHGPNTTIDRSDEVNPSFIVG